MLGWAVTFLVIALIAAERAHAKTGRFASTLGSRKMWIRLRGKGRPGDHGGGDGDLVVTVHVEPHSVFTLDGDDLRNAFLNSPWVKAVIPIRPGKEQAAIQWLKSVGVEGADGIDVVGEWIVLLARDLAQSSHNQRGFLAAPFALQGDRKSVV